MTDKINKLFFYISTFSKQHFIAFSSIVFFELFLSICNSSEAQTISFSGFTWDVKNALTSPAGPGLNYYNPNNVTKDANNHLHLKIKKNLSTGKWECAEVTTQAKFASGTYQFWVDGRIDLLNKNVVLGMFDYSGPDNWDENDIEITRWGIANNNNLHYTVYPALGTPMGNKHDDSNITLNGTYTTHRFIRKYDMIKFQTLGGHYDDNTNELYTHTFTNSGIILSKTSMPIDINFWLNDTNGDGLGDPPSDGLEAEIIIDTVRFFPDSCPESYEPNDSTAQAPFLFTNPLYQTSATATINSVISTGSDQDWYKIPVAGPGTLSVTLTNLPADYDLELYPINGLSGGALAHSYNNGTTNESMVYNYTLNASTILHVKAYPKSSSQYTPCSSYNLTSTWTPTSTCSPPSNDVCSSGVPTLPVGATCINTQGDIACATQTYAASACPSGLIQDVWYKFTANSTGTYTIILAPSSEMDGVVEVREGSCTGNVLGCKDAGGGNGAIENLDVSVTNATVYYVRVYEYNAPGNTTPPATTSFNICVVGNCTPITPSVSIAITSGSNPTCPNQTITFTAAPTNGGSSPSYQWKVGNINVGTNTATYTTSTLVNGQVVTCLMTSNSPCANPTTAISNAITVNSTTASNWIGNSNNTWHNPLNWSCGIVPDGNTDVVIGSGTPFNCVVNQDAVCKSLTISPNATLTVQAGKTINIFSNSTKITLPTITTTSFTNPTSNSATSGGNVINDGGSPVTTRGVCYATTSNPTTFNNIISGGAGTGSFVSNLTELTANTTYYLRAYATNNFGTAYGNQISFTTNSVTSFTIGQSYGGGIIFYIDGTSQHGLIAAIADIGTGAQWYNGSYVSTDAFSTADGSMNTTQIIIEQGNTGNYAAKLCRDYRGGGFSDWFLPAKDQLNTLYTKRSIVGGFTTHDYWSSTQFQSGNAWELDFYDGTLGIFGQDASAYVRAIRAF